MDKARLKIASKDQSKPGLGALCLSFLGAALLLLLLFGGFLASKGWYYAEALVLLKNELHRSDDPSAVLRNPYAKLLSSSQIRNINQAADIVSLLETQSISRAERVLKASPGFKQVHIATLAANLSMQNKNEAQSKQLRQSKAALDSRTQEIEDRMKEIASEFEQRLLAETNDENGRPISASALETQIPLTAVTPRQSYKSGLFVGLPILPWLPDGIAEVTALRTIIGKNATWKLERQLSQPRSSLNKDLQTIRGKRMTTSLQYDSLLKSAAELAAAAGETSSYSAKLTAGAKRICRAQAESELRPPRETYSILLYDLSRQFGNSLLGTELPQLEVLEEENIAPWIFKQWSGFIANLEHMLRIN
jgi:hypothetical protein